MSLPIKARSCHKAAPPVIEVAAGAAIAPTLDWTFSTLGQSSWLPAGCPVLYSENVSCFTRPSYSSHVLHRRAAQRTIVDGSGILLSCWHAGSSFFSALHPRAAPGIAVDTLACFAHIRCTCVFLAVCTLGPPMYKAVMQNSCAVNAVWCESHVVYRASGVRPNASAVKAAWCPRLLLLVYKYCWCWAYLCVCWCCDLTNCENEEASQQSGMVRHGHAG